MGGIVAMYLCLQYLNSFQTALVPGLLNVFSALSFYGYLYHWIGLLIAAFMGGLTRGGMWMPHRLKDTLKLGGANSVGDTAVFAAAQCILLLMNALCGFLVGAEFSLAI